MLYSVTAGAIRQLSLTRSERAPQDIKVVCVKGNRKAYQNTTIRPHFLWNDPLHPGLGGERRREVNNIWNDKHEVKPPSLPAGTHFNLDFFFYIHSSLLPSETCSTLPQSFLYIISLSTSTFSTDAPFTQTSLQSLLQSHCTLSIYARSV